MIAQFLRSDRLAGVLAIALTLAGFALAIAASSAPQAYDADSYLEEASSFVDGTPRLYWAHNYAYAAFLALAQIAGVQDRFGVALVQTTLLYASALVAAIAISRSTHASVSVAMVPLAAVALVPASAWSGYTLSEGLAAPVLLLVFALTILVTFRVLRFMPGTDRATLILVMLLGLLSGVAWMTRPALLWIPLTTGLIVVGLCVYAAWRGDRLALVAPVLFVIALVLITAPQLALGDPFKFELARVQAGSAGLYFRYATSLSECGPFHSLFFSPLTYVLVEPGAADAMAPDNPQWRLTTMVAHVVSGWDARPSPTYMERFADRRWLLMGAFSGFAIMAALTAAAILLRRFRTAARPRTAVIGVLVLLFAASQGLLAMTVAEFRFNLAGWLLAGCCLAVINGLRWWTPLRAGMFVLMGLSVSGVVLVIGQLTLMYSPIWLQCSGYLQGAP